MLINETRLRLVGRFSGAVACCCEKGEARIDPMKLKSREDKGKTEGNNAAATRSGFRAIHQESFDGKFESGAKWRMEIDGNGKPAVQINLISRVKV